MELLVSVDSVFFKTPDNKYWCETIYGYEFWERYLSVYENINIVSRTKHVDFSEIEGCLRVDGPNIKISELPFMRGMKDYIKKYFTFSKLAKESVKNSEIGLFRLPSVAAIMVLRYFEKNKKPYAIEVVADPEDAYATNKIAQIMYTKLLKKYTLKANGVSYVTKSFLQSKYPSFAHIHGETNKNFHTYYSSINLQDNFFSNPRKYKEEKKEYTIIHTANNINNENKGHRTVIEVVKKLRELNFDVNVIFIGDGTKKKKFEQLVKECGIEENVMFTGLLSSKEEVRDLLLKGDLFLFPSKAEGLPRALIEAMAVGLPCLSTPVNGIPELLEKKYLFNPSDINGFVKKIIQLIENPKELEKMSVINIEEAKKYKYNILMSRRIEFYNRLKKLSV